MRAAILGLPQSGRTTVWRALSAGHWAQHGNVAVVPMPDHRLPEIARAAGSKKVTPVRVELVDTVGDLSRGGAIYSELQGADGIIVVVRGFDGGFGEPTPKSDARTIRESLVLFDASAVETRMNTVRAELSKGRPQSERKELEQELGVLESFADHLARGGLLRDVASGDLAALVAKNQGLLTAKPWLGVINVDEGGTNALDDVAEALSSPAVALPAKLELELRELEPEEAKAFRGELGVPEDCVDGVLRALVDALGAVVFYTANENEARAWLVPKGTKAIDAAAKIHSDIARGFIRAEVVSWEDFVRCGGYANARAENLIRLVGKDYVVGDGDLILFRFNV